MTLKTIGDFGDYKILRAPSREEIMGMIKEETKKGKTVFIRDSRVIRKKVLGLFPKVEYEYEILVVDGKKEPPASEKTVNGAVELVRSVSERVNKKMMSQSLEESRNEYMFYEKRNSALKKLASFLKERDFSENVVNDIMVSLSKGMTSDFSVLLQKAKSIILDSISYWNPFDRKPKKNRPVVFSIIGPTGVGKTTTVIKLAARYISSTKSRDIGFVTLDYFRLGADEQLQKAARIMGVPMEALNGRDAGNPAVLRNIIDRYAAKNIKYIFIDTVGSSQKDKSVIDMISGFLSALKGVADLRVMLAVSATTKYIDLKEIVDSYSRVGFKSMIITKVDETNSLGSVLSVVYEDDIKVSFITTGQDVSGDLENATPEFLVEKALGSG